MVDFRLVDPRWPQAVEFHRVYYRREVWQTVMWRGFQCLQNPCDLFSLTELLTGAGTELLIEIGHWRGGSALYLVDTVPGLRVLAVDLLDARECPGRVSDARIDVLAGDCLSPATVLEVGRRVAAMAPQRVSVTLDADHSPASVGRQMFEYAPFVTVGGSLVVQDTNAGLVGDNPSACLQPVISRFLETHANFEIDRFPERHGLSFHLGGWLRRNF